MIGVVGPHPSPLPRGEGTFVASPLQGCVLDPANPGRCPRLTWVRPSAFHTNYAVPRSPAGLAVGSCAS